MIGLLRCLLSLTIIFVNSSYGYLNKSCKYMCHSRRNPLYSGEESEGAHNHLQIIDEQASKNLAPKRKDICKMFISGIIGTEPKEAYLSNNHYVINFALAVTGHYDSIHDWEKTKPQETMWINVEVWDRAAKESIQHFRKGASFNGLGTLIFNKWTDKGTGEERKQFKYRMQKLMTADEMALFNDLDAMTVDNSDSSSESSSSISQSPQSEQIDNTVTANRATVEANLAPVLVSVDPMLAVPDPTITKRAWSRPNNPAAPLNPSASQDADRRLRFTEVKRNSLQPPPKGKSGIIYGSYDPDAE